MEGAPLNVRAPAGLASHRRLKHVVSIRAASGPRHGDSVTPSAPPLPKELRTSERIKYPEVYSDSRDVIGAPGTRQEGRSVNESVFSTDQVQCWTHSRQRASCDNP